MCTRNRTKWWQEPDVPGGMEGNEIGGRKVQVTKSTGDPSKDFDFGL